MCRGCHVVAFFGGVLYKPLGLKLLKWQEKWLRELYGTLDLETGKRQYWQSYAELPKKNGKSYLVGGLPLYHLTMEEVERPEAYGCAAAKDQAGIVYRSAAYFARDNEFLRSRLKILDSTKRIIRKDGAGFYAVLSADGDIQDGIEPSLAIIDELHRWKTAKARTLWEVVTKGTISREESMRVAITTAGDALESELCYREHERARRILSGGERSGRYHCTLYAADGERIKSEPEYWKSREARVLANPSHEDHGGFLKDEKIVEEIENGKAAFLRYHLNIWGQSEDRWLQPGEWARGHQETRALMFRPCYLGIDLSATTDFTAMLMLFPDTSDGSYDLVPFFWIPKDRVSDLEKKLHVPLRRWIELGLIEVTDGDVVDYSVVEVKIAWAVENFHVQEICYDPWNATDLVTRLVNKGFNCVKVPQTITHLSAPMKHIHRKLLEGKVRHGGHEVLAWHAESVVSRTDGNGNIAPKKPDLMKDAMRIDGFAALVTAMVRGMIPENAWDYQVIAV
jgi:phage terminase large subunit-like protein